jgi:hypothetical protein
MKVDVVTRVTIDASPSEVFEYLSDLKYHYLWNPQMRDVKPVTVLKQGMTYDTINSVLGVKITSTNKVFIFDKDEKLGLVNESGPVHYRVIFQLVTKAEKTQVVCTTEVSTDSQAFAFTQPVLKVLAQRELQTDMQALKLAVEHKLV